MSELEVDIDDIIDTERFARTIADDIEGRLTSLTVSVNQLVDGQWAGVAASAFVPDWEQWRHGVSSVLDGIAQTREHLLAAAHSYSQQDSHNSGALESARTGATGFLAL